MMVLLAVVSGVGSAAQMHGRAPAKQAKKILEATGVSGGLVVHLGCGDGRLTAALRANESYLVHGLDADEREVETARRYIKSKALYGAVSVEHWEGRRLPYVENLVNLIVASEPRGISREEMMRVLAPRGVAYVKKGNRWIKKVKPWPEEMDEWTHYLHGPDNNAVSDDKLVGPPRHMRWRSEPLWCRSHDHLSSVSGVVSARGRIFYIADMGSVASVGFPSQWFLVARDAFSGVELWKMPVSPWESRFRGFRSGPPHVGRRLVAVRDRVYVTPGYGKPVVALDAETGDRLQTYPETGGTEEILCEDDTIYVVMGDPGAMEAAQKARLRGEDAADVGKSIMAVGANSGEVLWKRSKDEAGYVMPTTLAVSDGRVYYENETDVVCLDGNSGEQIWASKRPITLSRPTWLTPTLVVRDGVVLSGDRDASNTQGAGPLDRPGELKWKVSSMEPYRVGEVAIGKLYAFSARTGERLWSCPMCEGFNSPPDVLIARGLVWTGIQVRANEPGMTEGRDLLSGEVASTRPPDQEFFRVGMGHHRCYRNKATTEYLVMGRSGIEFIDLDTGKAVADHWVRGACQYGVMPCNGQIYVPPHSCACYIKAKIKGFNALAPEREGPDVQPGADSDPLERGPAYGSVDSNGTDADAWPTYRCDGSRSGKADCAVSGEMRTCWEAGPGGKLSSPVVAEGKVFVAAIEDYAVHAFNADTGREEWTYTVGGRVDSPPTIYKGRAIFGSEDGYVYCLRAADGEFVWKFRAASDARRVVDMNRLASVWPVHGSVLVQDDVAYFAAGRSSYLDGGMYLYGLDPETGEQVFRRRLYGRDPETGLEPQENIQGLNMPGALPDVLSSDGDSLFMRHKRFDLKGNEQPQNLPHLYSSVGFLDDNWWHRTYWIVGTQTGSGFGGWRRPGNKVPSGRLLVRDGSVVYGFGRNNYPAHGQGGGSHAGVGGIHYELFATEMKNGNHTPRWKRELPFWARAMVLAKNDTLFVAGPPVSEYLTSGKVEGRRWDEMAHEGKMGPWYGEYFLSLRDPEKAVSVYRGEKGGRLWAISARSGEKLSTYELDSNPVFDGLVAAAGRLYVSTQNGHILCMEPR